MSRKVLVAVHLEGGRQFGRVVLPDDFMNSQSWAHQHTEAVTRAFLTGGAPSPYVEGFGAAIVAGTLNIDIAAGEAFNSAGLNFSTLPAGTATRVTLPAANPANPRIDLIVAVLAQDQDAANVLLPHRKLRIAAEYVAGQGEFPPENENVPTERQNRATVVVRQGVAAASPVAPVAGANEVPLWRVRVEAGAVALTGDKLTDVRPTSTTLYNAVARIAALEATVTTAGLAEIIDDNVDRLIAVAPNTGLSKLYNDPANSFTLSGVAATQAVMGMMSAADKTKLDHAASANTASALVQRDANGDFNARRITLADQLKAAFVVIEQTAAGQQPTLLELRNAGGGAGAGSQIDFLEAGVVVGRIKQNFSTALSNEGSFHFFFTQVPGAGMAECVKMSWGEPRLKVYGNLDITGTISKGGGSFQIDHPRDPENKDLVHGFVESHEYLLFYRVRVQLMAGSATVDVDDALGLEAGTFARLAQAAEAVAFRHGPGPARVHVEDDGLVYIGEEVGGVATSTFSLASSDAGDTAWVTVLLMAARNDPFIRADRFVDATTKRLVPEQLKPAPTVGELALLDPQTEPVAVGDPRDDTTVNVTVGDLIGKQGYPRHPNVILGGGPVPSRVVTYEAPEE